MKLKGTYIENLEIQNKREELIVKKIEIENRNNNCIQLINQTHDINILKQISYRLIVVGEEKRQINRKLELLEAHKK